jgi:hypothetical protein
MRTSKRKINIKRKRKLRRCKVEGIMKQEKGKEEIRT